MCPAKKITLKVKKQRKSKSELIPQRKTVEDYKRVPKEVKAGLILPITRTK